MLLDLIRALPTAVVVGIVPGWFWARLLRASTDRVEQITYSAALSMALVPVTILIPTRLLGTGVTLSVAVASPLIVSFAGLLAYLRFGSAKDSDEPLAPPPPPLGTLALVLLVLAFGIALGVVVGAVPGVQREYPIRIGVMPGTWALLAIVVLVFFAGLVYLVESRWEPASPPQEERLPFSQNPQAVLAQRLLLPAVLVLALLRGYLGPVLHDWPYMRGVDLYSHAVMAESMMTKGKIEPYLIYPPGFHTITAMICRMSGLEPLEVFPLLAPLLLLLAALALYVLAKGLWGWHYGVLAALFCVLLGGTYYYYNDAMYPNLVASQFLMVIAVGALVGLYASPSIRSALVFALLGSSVVLYHQVSSLYMAVLLAVVGVLLLPYLLVRDRRSGVVLLSSLALVGLLSVLFAWDTYDLPQAIAGLLGGSGSSITDTAVNMAIGTQHPYPLYYLSGAMVSQPVAWLGLLGVILVVGELLRKRVELPQTLAYLTLISWALLMFVGSRTSLTGFPQRFGRDLGIPLAVFAAFAFAAILRSLLGARKQVATVFVASLTVLLATTLVGVRLVSSLEIASAPSTQMTITPQIAAAGEWLKENNSGGNIMVSPHGNQVPSRMMLAMGWYSALQSFDAWQIEHPRDLPPTGPGPLRDVLWVLHHPEGERTNQILKKYDVRYIVLYKNIPDRFTTDYYWKLFKSRPDLYRTVFENEDVLIVVRRQTASAH